VATPGAAVGAVGAAGAVGVSQAANAIPRVMNVNHLIKREFNMKVLLLRNWRDYSIGFESNGTLIDGPLMKNTDSKIDLSMERMYNPHVMVGTPTKHV
jgi:hypothetical protein